MAVSDRNFRNLCYWMSKLVIHRQDLALDKELDTIQA